jgi:hypothetical protein
MWSLMRAQLGRSVGRVEVYTVTDADGKTWRVEMAATAARVYRARGRFVEATPVRGVRDIPSLGDWLVERGLSIEDLRRA